MSTRYCFSDGFGGISPAYASQASSMLHVKDKIYTAYQVSVLFFGSRNSSADQVCWLQRRCYGQ